MKRFQLVGLSDVLVSFAIISGDYAFVAAAVMGNSEVTTMVGGAPMYPSKNIIQNAVSSKDHTTLVAAVRAGSLVDTLSGAGPFTVFAPANEVFTALPAGTVGKLLEPESKPTLVKVLTYHMASSRFAAQDPMKAITDGSDKAVLKAVEGDPLTVMQKGDHLTVTDDKGGVAMVTIGNVYQSSGVIHVAGKVLMPQSFP